MLDAIGVDQIEAGIPVMGGHEKEAIKEICKLGLRASIMGWNRAVIRDIESSLECGTDAVAISTPTSDIHIEYKLRSSKDRVLADMVRAAEFAKLHGVYVSVNAEDASRSDPAFLFEFAQAAKEAGADRLRFCDTVGILDPFRHSSRLKN